MVINEQERRFHYAGMSGEGVGKEPAPLPAPASSAVLIDVPRTARQRRAWWKEAPSFTLSGARPAARCSWPLGSWGGGRGGRQRARGQLPRRRTSLPPPQQLDPGGVGCTADLWLMTVSPGLWLCSGLGWGSHPPCPAGGETHSCPGKGFGSKKENVPPARGACVTLARGTRRGVTGT